MRTIWLATGVVAAAVLAGCTSEPPAEQQTTTSNAPAGHGSLAQCLNDHGVPAAAGPAAKPPPGVDPDAWHEAMEACASFAPGPTG